MNDNNPLAREQSQVAIVVWMGDNQPVVEIRTAPAESGGNAWSATELQLRSARASVAVLTRWQQLAWPLQ